jgi:hypothetical protein
MMLHVHWHLINSYFQGRNECKVRKIVLHKLNSNAAKVSCDNDIRLLHLGGRVDSVMHLCHLQTRKSDFLESGQILAWHCISEGET